MDTSVGLSIRNLTVTFDGTAKVLDGLQLDARPGEILAIVGASGCGKSTLLRTIAGLQTYRPGSIEFTRSDLGGEATKDGSMPERSTSLPPGGVFTQDKIGFVFQDATLLPWRTVFANVGLPIELHQWNTKPIDQANVRQRIAAALESVELDSSTWQLFPRQLSGGMKMRTSIARALVIEPRVLLLDEPFAALDELLRTKLNQLLLNLWETRKHTILFVTHNIAEAVWLSHRVVVFGKGKLHKVVDNPLGWPRTISQRSSLEFAQQYGLINTALEEAVHE